MFEATTHQIRVRVNPAFIQDQSDPSMNRYFFSYTVEIENLSPNSVQLMSRHWIITDGLGRVEEVTGPGVVGQQPTLEPGEKFEYSSFCPLPTPTGSMQGRYTMVDGNGSQMDVQIPEFLLVEPGHYH